MLPCQVYTTEAGLESQCIYAVRRVGFLLALKFDDFGDFQILRDAWSIFDSTVSNALTCRRDEVEP